MSAPPIHFRVVLSIQKWTPESIGWTINGITPSPTAVVIHFLVFKGTFGATFARENKLAAHILLIVNPGIITDAKACQTSVSKAAIPTLVFAPSWSPNCFLACKKRVINASLKYLKLEMYSSLTKVMEFHVEAGDCQ